VPQDVQKVLYRYVRIRRARGNLWRPLLLPADKNTAEKHTMNIGRHCAVYFFLLFLVVVTVGVILKDVVAPWIVRRQLIATVQENCETCKLSLSRVYISVMPLALSSRHVRFTGGTPNVSVVYAEAERVYIPFSFFPLFAGRLRLRRIEIEQPMVKVTEGDLEISSSSATDSRERCLDLEIEGIEVIKGSFTYVQEHLGRKGSVNVSRINVVVGPVGSSDRRRNEDVEGSADGLFEGTGQFHLQVRAKIFEKVPNADVKLEIMGQDLANLNQFLSLNDGIRLKGMLIEGRSLVAIRGARLSSFVYARYRGLSVKIKKTEDRGALSAFFQNFLASITVGSQNVDGGNYDHTGKVDLKRKPKESLVSFTLRGMKEAAMKVSSQGGR